jgi:3-deoxy-manno-octulosonate cytidylyltransferase (CMP-KDO synthetase)
VTAVATRPRPKFKLPKKPHDVRDDYAAFMRGKRVILVGPAGYLQNRKRGAWIDSFDVVVKLNWGETLNAKDYGSRTDVLYKRLLKLGHADDMLISEYEQAGMKWLIAIDSQQNKSAPYINSVIGGRIPWFVDVTTRQALTRELGTSALIGPVAVRHILNMGVESLTVTGCDFYLTGYAGEYGGKVYRHYMKRREGIIGPTHDGPKQLRWLANERARDARLVFDDVLDDLANNQALPDPRVAEGVTVIIPARYASSRFPGKPLAPINGKPMILHVCERVKRLGCTVMVATDDKRIEEVVTAAGFKAVMTSDALTGTDRVAQAALKTARGGRQMGRIIVNVQGDEPLVDSAAIIAVIEAKRKNRFDVINAMTPLKPGELENRNAVKAVVKKDKHLAYCSRHPVPTQWKQLGLYAFSPDQLQQYAAQGKRSGMEAGEDVEILRFLDMGVPVRMVEVRGSAQAVDRPEDIAIVEGLMK